MPAFQVPSPAGADRPPGTRRPWRRRAAPDRPPGGRSFAVAATNTVQRGVTIKHRPSPSLRPPAVGRRPPWRRRRGLGCQMPAFQVPSPAGADRPPGTRRPWRRRAAADRPPGGRSFAVAATNTVQRGVTTKHRPSPSLRPPASSTALHHVGGEVLGARCLRSRFLPRPGQIARRNKAPLAPPGSARLPPGRALLRRCREEHRPAGRHHKARTVAVAAPTRGRTPPSLRMGGGVAKARYPPRARLLQGRSPARNKAPYAPPGSARPAPGRALLHRRRDEHRPAERRHKAPTGAVAAPTRGRAPPSVAGGKMVGPGVGFASQCRPARRRDYAANAFHPVDANGIDN